MSEDGKAEGGKKEKKRQQDYLKPLYFFWWAIDFGRGLLWRGGGVTGVHLCMPARGPGPPAPFCSDACMPSLAWLGYLHLMVYSYSAVHDAVPWAVYVHSRTSTERAPREFSDWDERIEANLCIYLMTTAKYIYMTRTFSKVKLFRHTCPCLGRHGLFPNMHT